MIINEWKDKIASGAMDARLAELYSDANLDRQRTRYVKALASYQESFSVGDDAEISLFSAPGRT